MMVTAPTVVAAINAGGVTFHSFFQIPFGPFLPGSDAHPGQHRIRREKKDILRSLELLVIDEISMVRAGLLDGMDCILRRYRQLDQRFIELLNRVRDNRLDPPTLNQLNCRHIPNFSARDGQGYITLCTHNRSADAINDAKLKALPGKSRRFNAEVEDDFPEHAYPTAATLEVKTGAQVMFTRNDMTAEKSDFNGKISEIAGISGDTIEVR
jgi:hypothetical protein